MWGSSLRKLGWLLGAVLLGTGAAPSCTATANVGDVWMSLDEDGARRRSVFFTDSKTIVCIAEVSAGRDNATLEMQFHRVQAYDFVKEGFSNVDVITDYMEVRPAITQGKPQRVALRVVRTSTDENGKVKEDEDAAFLPGRMLCEVRLDGELKKSVTFNIDFPSCPGELIRNNDTCFGFFRLGQECPESGALGAPEPTCRCTEDGWEC
jgi:hypothetical protein